MADDEPQIEDLDFDGQMHHLAIEAQLKSSPPAARFDRKDLMLALGQMVRPLALELENIKRATIENNLLLTVLGKAAKAPAATDADAFGQINAQLQRLGAVETANQKLFDALHTELKGYKDSFLFDALQRPFIRDLVSIFDDFTAVHVQVSKRLQAMEPSRDGADSAGKTAEPRRDAAGKTGEDSAPQSEADFLRTLAGNMENEVHHLLEVFLRLEVVLSQSPAGTPLDKRLHRTVAFEPAPHAGHDAQVVRSLKPGFTWRERMIRPEEVVVYRWLAEPPAAVAPEEKHSVPDSKPAPPPENRRPAADAKIGRLK